MVLSLSFEGRCMVGRLMLRMIVSFLLLAALSTMAEAQLAELQPGTRVRVRGADIAGRLQGVVLTRVGDSLTIARPSGPPLPSTIGTLSQVEISRGKSRGRGALRGLIWGAGIGAVFGLIPVDDAECDRDPSAYGCGSRAESMVLSALGGSMIGVPIGAIIGVERWVPLSMPARISLSVAPGREGVRVSLPVGAPR